ncbi:MAG: DUF3857 domain-containing protein [Polyangiales bacterium]
MGAGATSIRARLGVLLCGTLIASVWLTVPPSAAAAPRPSSARAAGLSRAAIPAWVDRLPEAKDAPVAAEGGSQCLLYDRQVRIVAHKEVSYTRWVRRILNEAGLQDSSQVTIDFEKDDRLVLHHVTLWRDGQPLERLNMSAVRVAQRETRLEQQIYDERQTAVLFVSDLRVGDVLDYAYSIERVDLTAGGRYADGLLLGIGEPVARLHIRVIAPTDEPVQYMWHGRDRERAPLPEKRSIAKNTEYVWDLYDRPAVAIEAGAPPSHDPLPWVQLSQFRSWSEVARVATQLFSEPDRDEAAIRHWVEDAALATATKPAFLLRAIRFVQDEIRYVGIETGLSRRKPAAPSETLARRYGDCKDKSALLVALLRRAGYVAHPALVHSRYRADLDEWRPSLSAFDHAIVQIDTEGGPYWVDATELMQGGGLSRLRQSDFALALVLDEHTTGLTPLGPLAQAGGTLRVHDQLSVTTPESQRPTQLEQRRTYTDEAADTVRLLFHSQAKRGLQDHFTQAIRADFSDAEPHSPLHWDDDREHNVVNVVTRYTLPSFWQKTAQNALHERQWVAAPLAELFGRMPAATHERTLPLALQLPQQFLYRASVEVPFDPAIAAEQDTIHGPAFTLTMRVTPRAHRVVYDYAFSGTASVVAETQLDAHREAVTRAYAKLVHPLRYLAPVPDGINWPGLGFLAGFTLLCAFLLRRMFRLPPSAASLPGRMTLSLVGSGAIWLIALRLGAAVFVTSRDAYRAGRDVLSRARWHVLWNPLFESESNPAVEQLMNLTVAVVLLVFYLGLTKLFIDRRRTFRHASLAECGLAALGGLWMAFTEAEGAAGAWLINLCVTIAFATYVWRAQRVRDVFVH